MPLTWILLCHLPELLPTNPVPPRGALPEQTLKISLLHLSKG